MERPRPPYLIKKKGWKGQTVWYYWKRPGPQIRIRGDYGSREFWLEYEAAAQGDKKEAPAIRKPTASLAWLLDRYRETTDWLQLSEATRRQRDNIFKRILTANPKLSFGDVDKKLIVDTREAKKATPSEANNFLDAMRGLFKWAEEAQHVEANPVVGIKNLKRPKTGGFPMWEEEDIALFQHKWPIGTRERLAFEIFLNTGLRRGDVACLGKQHIRNGRVRIVTEKTKTEVDIPVTQALLDVIAKSPTGDLVFIANVITGHPLHKAALGNWFKRAATAAGVKGKNGHGLRKASATRLAEAGATPDELNAVFGWEGPTQSSVYTKKANRKKLADNAVAKLIQNSK
jgi:integrase